MGCGIGLYSFRHVSGFHIMGLWIRKKVAKH